MATLASLYSIIMGPWAVLSRRAGGGANRATQAYAQKYRNDLLRIVQKYELDGDRIAAIAARDRLVALGKWQAEKLAYLMHTRTEQGKNIRERVKGLRSQFSTENDTHKRFIKEWQMPYATIVQKAHSARTATQQHVMGRPQQFYNIMAVMTGAPGIKAETYDPDSPQFPSTWRAVVRIADPSGEYIEIYKDGPIEFKMRWKEGVLKPTGSQGEATLRMIDDYNNRNAEYQTRDADFQSRLNILEGQIGKWEAELDSPNADEGRIKGELEQWQSKKKSLLSEHEKDSGVEANPDLVQAEKDRLESIINHPGYLDALEQLRGNLPEDEQRRRTLAVIISHPPFRAWAEDHGYDLDRLGVAKVTWEGNKPTVVSYKLGADSVKAYAVWARQSKLEPGNYGRLVSPDTGETVLLTLKDGSTVLGRRLKFHASDPIGTIRISTEEGELKEFTADQLKSIANFTRPGAPSSAERAAKRMAAGEDIAAVRKYLTQEVEKDLEYHTTELAEGLQYYKWKKPHENAGEYVTEAEWRQLKTAVAPQVHSFKGTFTYTDEATNETKTYDLNGFISGKEVWITNAQKNAFEKVEEDAAVSLLTQIAASTTVQKHPVGVKQLVNDVMTYRWATPVDIVFKKRSVLDVLDTEDQLDPYEASITVDTDAVNMATAAAPAPVMEQKVVLPVEGTAGEFFTGTKIAVPSVTYKLPEEKAGGGVVGADGPEVIKVGEEGPEFVIPNPLMTPEIIESIRSLAADRGIEIDTSVAVETEEPPEEPPEESHEEEEDELDLLQEGVTQKARGNYKLGLAVLDELESQTGVKPPPTILEIKQIVGLTRSLTLSVSYMEETLNRAENSEKMSPEWNKHMSDFNAYSDRVTQLQAEIKKLTERVDMDQLAAKATEARAQFAAQRGGGTV